jgi:hypothetical protein
MLLTRTMHDKYTNQACFLNVFSFLVLKNHMPTFTQLSNSAYTILHIFSLLFTNNASFLLKEIIIMSNTLHI